MKDPDLDRLYNTCFQDVYRYLCGLTGNASLAEELAADTCLKALEGRESFRGDCDLRVWLCRIAKNAFLSRLRKDNRLESLDAMERDLPNPESSLEERLLDREDARRIRRHLHDLPETSKEVFLWRVYGELSFQEIGDLFGRSQNWACVTYHRARARILAMLKEEEEHGTQT